MSETQTPTSPAPVDSVVSKNLLKDADFRSRPISEVSIQTALADAAKAKADEKVTKDESATSSTEEKESKVDEGKGEGSNESSSEDDKVKGSSGLKKRFSKLTAEKATLKEQNDTLLARLADLEAKVSGKKVEESTKTQTDFKFDKPKPKLDDFDSIADHAEAVAEWTYAKNRAQERAETEVVGRQQSERKTIDDFLEKGNALDKELGLEPGEWQETVRGEHYMLPPYAAQAVAAMDGLVGAKVLYHIASDEAVADKFTKMSDIQKLTFIGKLEAKYEAEAKPESSGGNGLNKSISKAKQPGKTIKGSSVSVKFDRSRPIAELAANAKITSQADYKRLRNK